MKVLSRYFKFSAIIVGLVLSINQSTAGTKIHKAVIKPGMPLAITMWDFSWLERRWTGGGYEDWDKVLNELVDRGYNAVRIDAYPHLVATDPQKEWTLEIGRAHV